MKRKSGILCHPTSMPSRYGIGEMGQAMLGFIDFLTRAGQSIWQILPLGPTGYGDSPYQPFSAFAGNPLLIGLDWLREDGLIHEADLVRHDPFPEDRVVYGRVIDYKNKVLRRSYERFCSASGTLRAEAESFYQQNLDWLEDFALFMAIKRHLNFAVWTAWPQGIALHQAEAVDHWHGALAQEVDYERYLQFQFDRQWRRVRAYAHQANITIMGDIPIFMGHDSVDVWSHQELFQLDDRGQPLVVAGVPPDYFSPTGQLWGNPHYRWDLMRENGYAWWVARLRAVLNRVDLVRLDHFRGFSGYWEVPAGEKTAIHGCWVRGPGPHLFHTVKQALGSLPIIAEDLGVITADVVALRQQFGLPGMRVLQFAFDGDASSPHLPHNYTVDSVVYTGTHDNDTAIGWYGGRTEEGKHRVRVYAGTDGRSINWDLIRLAMTSVGEVAVFPLQDVLGLGGEGRLNTPGRPDGNWTWRYREGMLQPQLADALRELAHVSGRWVESGAELPETAYETLEYEEPGSPTVDKETP
jgi:4-alpha-glucanotransferase